MQKVAISNRGKSKVECGDLMSILFSELDFLIRLRTHAF